MTSISRPPVVVCYHKNCPDGITSAWILLRFHLNYDTNVTNDVLLPLKAGTIVFESHDWTDKHVFFLDIAPKSVDELQKILNVAKSVTILDHHQTNLPLLEFFKNNYDSSLGNDLSRHHLYQCDIDMSMCGAQLTWKFVESKLAKFPVLDPQEFSSIVKRPSIIDYVADQDLWLWKLENSKPILAAMDWNFETLNQLYENKLTLSDLFKKGTLILALNQKRIENILLKMQHTRLSLNGQVYEVAIAPCDDEALVSDLGAQMLDRKLLPVDFSLSFRYDFVGKGFQCSLRSAKFEPSEESKQQFQKHPCDVAKIAETLGRLCGTNGGGHCNASGCFIPHDKFIQFFS